MQDIEYPYNAFVADVFEADEFAQALLDHLRNHPEESKKAPAILDQLHTNFGLDEGTYRRLKLEVESIRTAYLALNRLQDAARTAESDNGFVITAFGPQAPSVQATSIQAKGTTEKKSTRAKAASSSKTKAVSAQSPQPITAHSASSPTPKSPAKRTRSNTKVAAATDSSASKNQNPKPRNLSTENSTYPEGMTAMAVEVENEVPAPAEQARQRLSAMAQRGEFNSSINEKATRVAPPRISARREEIDLLPKNSPIPRKIIWAVVGLVPVAGLVWLMMSYTKVNPDLVVPGDVMSANENVAETSPALTTPEQTTTKQTTSNTKEQTEPQSTANNASVDSNAAAITASTQDENSSSEEQLLTPVDSSTANDASNNSNVNSNQTAENNTLENNNAPVENSVSDDIPTRPQNDEQILRPVSERSTTQNNAMTNAGETSNNTAGTVAQNTTAENTAAQTSGVQPATQQSQPVTPQQTPSESTSTSQPVEPTWSNPAVVGENAPAQNADIIFKELSQQAQDLYLENAEGQGQTALSLLAQLEQSNATPDQLRDGYTLVARGYEALSKIYHAQGDRVLSNRYDQQAVLHWRKIQSIPASPTSPSQNPNAPKKPVVEDYSL